MWQPMQPSWPTSFLPFSASPWVGGAEYFGWFAYGEEIFRDRIDFDRIAVGRAGVMSSPQKRGM